jgi:hypothetical protein
MYAPETKMPDLDSDRAYIFFEERYFMGAAGPVCLGNDNFSLAATAAIMSSASGATNKLSLLRTCV